MYSALGAGNYVGFQWNIHSQSGTREVAPPNTTIDLFQAILGIAVANLRYEYEIVA